MKNLILNISKLNKSFDIVSDDTIYIFENVKEYEEEIIEIIENNKMSFTDLSKMIESWGGKIKAIPLKKLINDYYKNL
tara:strand:+ start:7392 stop:7625 length:234 start_codon:yes stop_codon:yes gene_type:complete